MQQCWVDAAVQRPSFGTVLVNLEELYQRMLDVNDDTAEAQTHLRDRQLIEIADTW
jgi:hypothetical protein